MTEIIAVPFSWNDPMAETAQEYFSSYNKVLSYQACSAIGTALAKLKLLEEQGAKVSDNAEVTE